MKISFSPRKHPVAISRVLATTAMAFGLAGLSAHTQAQTASPAAAAQQAQGRTNTPNSFVLPTPSEWQTLSPEERRSRAQGLREQFRELPPQDRQALRQQMRERFEQLSPEQRRELADKARNEWQRLSPEDRERLHQERRAYIQSLSPAERAELRRERQKLKEQLPEDERRQLFERMNRGEGPRP